MVAGEVVVVVVVLAVLVLVLGVELGMPPLGVRPGAGNGLSVVLGRDVAWNSGGQEDGGMSFRRAGPWGLVE